MPHRPDPTTLFKNRLGAFIHHPATSLVVVVAILISVTLIVLHVTLGDDHPWQVPIERAEWALMALFFCELSIKCYVAPDKLRFLGQYWVDIIAILPWAQSLRVLRILRLLRVFRVAIILSRRVRFLSALFRSAVGEYVVLSMIMVLLLFVGSFALYVSEARARVARQERFLVHCAQRLNQIEAELDGRTVLPEPPETVALRSKPSASELRDQLDRLVDRVDRHPELKTDTPRRTLLRELDLIDGRLPADKPLTFGDKSRQGDLAEFENSFWATLYFLVATEPMINVPTTTVGRLIVLAVMFGGLTTFAIFTGVVTALMVNRLKRRMEIDDMDRFQLNNHILICGWNRLVPLIIEEILEAADQNSALVIIADLEQPPPEVAAIKDGARVYFVRGDCTKPEALEQGRVAQARLAIIVADTTINRSDQDRDARTVLAALMIERMSPGIYTCAELLNRDNEPHLRAAGIEEVIVTSEVGGHHLAMAAMHSGITEVLSELLTAKVGKTLVKLPVPEDFVGVTYGDSITRFKQERDDLVIGIEIKGQDGNRAEGYAMLVNPKGDVVLGARDNLILIAITNRKNNEAKA